MNSIHNGLKVPIAPHPPRPYGLTSMHDTEVPREDNWEALLHATFSDGSVGPPIPPIAYNDSIWGGQGIDVDIFTPRARVMVCACEVDGGLDHPLGKNCATVSQPLGVLWNLWYFCGRNLDWTIWDWNKHHMESSMARWNHQQIGTRDQYMGDHHQLQSRDRHYFPTGGYTDLIDPWGGHDSAPTWFQKILTVSWSTREMLTTKPVFDT